MSAPRRFPIRTTARPVSTGTPGGAGRKSLAVSGSAVGMSGGGHPAAAFPHGTMETAA